MSFFSNLYDIIQKDEQWVVTELQKAISEAKAGAAVLTADINGVTGWIKAHQAQLQSIMTIALQGVALAGGVPQLAPLIPVATTALDAAEVGIDALSKSVLAQTPSNDLATTATNTYHAVIDARTAVTSVLKAATSSGTAAPSA